MSKLPPILLLAGVVVTIWSGSSAAGAASKATTKGKDCAVSYKDSGYFTNAETRWTYFRDVVIEFERQPDGSAVVAFQKSSRRYRIPKDAAFLAAAEKAMADSSEVHVAVEEGKGAGPRPGGDGTETAPLPRVQWLDPKEQHSSCR